jgi:hypothetical protein
MSSSRRASVGRGIGLGNHLGRPRRAVQLAIEPAVVVVDVDAELGRRGYRFRGRLCLDGLLLEREA